MPFFDIFASPGWSPLRMRIKVALFFIFFQELSNKEKIKALRPKMTKIASRGGLKFFFNDTRYKMVQSLLSIISTYPDPVIATCKFVKFVDKRSLPLVHPDLCFQVFAKLIRAHGRVMKSNDMCFLHSLSRLKHYPRWRLQRSQRVLDRQLENYPRGRISRRAVRCTGTPPACRDGHKRQQPTWSGPERFRRPSTCGSHEPHRKLRPLRTVSLNIYPSPTRRTNLAPSLEVQSGRPGPPAKVLPRRKLGHNYPWWSWRSLLCSDRKNTSRNEAVHPSETAVNKTLRSILVDSRVHKRCPCKTEIVEQISEAPIKTERRHVQSFFRSECYLPSQRQKTRNRPSSMPPSTRVNEE